MLSIIAEDLFFCILFMRKWFRYHFHLLSKTLHFEMNTMEISSPIIKENEDKKKYAVSSFSLLKLFFIKVLSKIIIKKCCGFIL